MTAITSAEFVCSNTDFKKCPPATKPEFAFIGRSNVGKSSLINMLVSKKGLAKTSGKPGKTQLINHFDINDAWYLVDLPGYGYASVSKSKRAQWGKFIEQYILQRENLVSLFVLIDSRLPLQKIDNEFMQWLGEKQIPFAIIFTKTDKLSKNQLAKSLKDFKKTFLKSWSALPPNFDTSSVSGNGREEVLGYIDYCIGLFDQRPN